MPLPRASGGIRRMIEQAIQELLKNGIPADRLINQAPKAALPPTGNTGTGYTPGDTSVATGKLADDAVTFAKMQNLTTDRLIGRDTASTGDPEQLTVSGGIEFTGSGGIQRSALTGDVTASAGSGSTTIANDAVTYAKMQNVSAASKLLGRGDSGSGDPQEITLGAGLTMTGTTISSSGGAALTVEEVGGSPTDSAVTKIVFPNGTLGIASHVATYTPAGGALDLSQLLALDPANAEIDGSNIVTKWPSTNANGLSMRGVVGAGSRPLYVASVWNSQPVIRYDGTDDYTVTTLPGSFAPSFTFIVVCAPKNTTTKGMLEWSGGILNGTPHVYFQRNSTNVRVYTDANYQWTIAHTTDVPRVYCLVYDGGGLYTLSVDGSAQTDYNGSASGYPTDIVAAKALFLGSGASGMGNVDFGDVQLYNRALSPSEQSTLVTALKTKYGI